MNSKFGVTTKNYFISTVSRRKRPHEKKYYFILVKPSKPNKNNACTRETLRYVLFLKVQVFAESPQKSLESTSNMH